MKRKSASPAPAQPGRPVQNDKASPPPDAAPPAPGFPAATDVMCVFAFLWARPEEDE